MAYIHAGLIALILCQILSLLRVAEANIAAPYAFNANQPDGAQIALMLSGDEWNNRLQDTNGYTVVETKQNGRRRYVYAGGVDNNGDLVGTAHEVGKVRPDRLGLPKGIRGRGRNRDDIANSTSRSSRLRETMRMRRLASTGTLKNLVVMVRFADHASRPLPDTASLNILFNNVGAHSLCPTGSVRDVWLKNSYGRLTIDSVLTGWITVPQTEAYAAGGNSGLTSVIHEALRAALSAADSTIDFKQFDANGDNWIDMITFIHSGYAAEWGGTDSYGAYYSSRIWSHKWGMSTFTSGEGVRVSNYHISPALWATSGTGIGRIGVIAHETGHYLGLPDLYDTDGDGSGIGSWGLMANSWGFDGSQYYPPHLSAWSKQLLGYVTPIDITTPGIYYASAVEDNPQVYRIRTGFPTNEYLLIENRQNIAFDARIPTGGSGLAIFHIDDAAGYSTQSFPGASNWPAHYRVALMQADGAYNLERNQGRGDAGDTYKIGGTGGVTVASPTTTPSTNAYQGNVLRDSGITIRVLSASNYTMAFQVDIAGAQTTCGSAGVTCSGTDVLQSTRTCVTGSTCTQATCCVAFCSVSTNVGKSCSDNNVATINDVCTSAGVCQGTPATCSNTGVVCGTNQARLDSTACTPGSTCNAQTCCVAFCSLSTNLGAACNDNNANTFNDVCTASGVCQGVPFCQVSTNLGKSCSDNNAATINDVCTSAGVCEGTPATCSNTGVVCGTTQARLDSTACTPGSTCNAQTCCVAFCSLSTNLGAACNDNNANTFNDVCTAAGVCQGVSFCQVSTNLGAACNDNDASTFNDVCTDAGVCQGVQFCSVPTNVGASCNDNNAATINDVCTSEGTCMGTVATCSNTGVTCPQYTTLKAEQACTPGTNCNIASCCVSICANTANAGQTCNDGNVNTVNDVCTTAGTCASVTATCANTVMTCTSGTLRSTVTCTPGQTCTATNCCSQTMTVASIQVSFVFINNKRYYQAVTSVVDATTRVALRGFTVTGRFQSNSWTENLQSVLATSTSTAVTMRSLRSWSRTTLIDRSARFCVTNVGNVAGYTYAAGSVTCVFVQ